MSLPPNLDSYPRRFSVQLLDRKPTEITITAPLGSLAGLQLPAVQRHGLCLRLLSSPSQEQLFLDSYPRRFSVQQLDRKPTGITVILLCPSLSFANVGTRRAKRKLGSGRPRWLRRVVLLMAMCLSSDVWRRCVGGVRGDCRRLRCAGAFRSGCLRRRRTARRRQQSRIR